MEQAAANRRAGRHRKEPAEWRAAIEQHLLGARSKNHGIEAGGTGRAAQPPRALGMLPLRLLPLRLLPLRLTARAPGGSNSPLMLLLRVWLQ